jgi:hypothetical protein
MEPVKILLKRRDLKGTLVPLKRKGSEGLEILRISDDLGFPSLFLTIE